MSTRMVLVLVVVCAAAAVYGNSIDGNSHQFDTENGVESRRKKHKHSSSYLMPFVFVVMVLKALVIPIVVFKSMAVVSGVSVIMSILSLAVASFVGRSQHKKSPRPVGIYNYYHRDDAVDKNDYPAIDDTVPISNDYRKPLGK